MKITHIKVYAVIAGAPVADYEAELPTRLYRGDINAQRYADWLRFDQGRRDTQVVELDVECAMICDTVIIPDNVNCDPNR